MADFSKIGRNNKNRGRKFERTIADLFGWTRVPYSGAIKEWGGADVVDGFYKKKGLWAAECKTVVTKPDKKTGKEDLSIPIKAKWVGQMLGGETNGRHGFLIIRRVWDSKLHVGKKAPEPIVVMFEDTHDWFVREVARRSRDAANIQTGRVFQVKSRGKTYNFRFSEQALEWLYLSDAPFIANCVWFQGDWSMWYATKLSTFKQLMHEYDIMEHDDDQNQQ
jgi:hypothetical protein